MHSLRNHLEIFQQTFANALNENSPVAPQPLHISIPLRIHQLTALESMRIKEINLRSGLDISGEKLFSQYAFLGDKVGVGKTLTVLGHISQMATYPLTQAKLNNLRPFSTDACFSIYSEPLPENVFDSLIVVPHTIYRQWQDTIEKYTTLTAHFLKSQRDLDNNLLQNLRNAHLTLISNTLLPTLMTSLRARSINVMWRRIFYDEADTVKFSGNSIFPPAMMTWYVTASYVNMLFANQHLHSYLIRQLSQDFINNLDSELREIIVSYVENHPVVSFFRTKSHAYFQKHISLHPLCGHLVVRNANSFIDSSSHLPPLTQTIIRCRNITPYLINASLPHDTEEMLHAGDIQGALQSLGVPSHSPTTIVEAVTGFRQKEIDRLKRLLSFKESETYASPRAKEEAILNLQTKINISEIKLNALKERIENVSKDTCSICFDLPNEAVITPCCSRIFCGSCILSWLSRSHACPLCRTSFHPTELCGIGVRRDATTAQLPKKMDALFDIIKTNPSGKFLIFSRFENPLDTIQNIFEEHISIATLQGNKDSIAKILHDFESGKLKVLLLNSRSAAAGINIPSATHLILLHKMLPDEEKQILGRAYRLGRTKPLHFIKLLHQNE